MTYNDKHIYHETGFWNKQQSLHTERAPVKRQHFLEFYKADRQIDKYIASTHWTSKGTK